MSHSHWVRRRDADRYLRLTLLGFGGSVLLTRAYLALTGYPQVGGETLHFSHALWGGLLLFVGALLPLLIVNERALTWSALLTGVGVGLFIDEVGKLVTVDYDYFFQPAAPVIWAVFLLTVWLYVRVRGRRRPSTRTQLHAALELLGDAVDGRLDESEQAELCRRLTSARDQQDRTELIPLAGALADAVTKDVLPPVDPPGRLRRFVERLGRRTDRLLTQARLRRLLLAAFVVVGLLALADLVVVAVVAVDLVDRSVSDIVRTANEFTGIEIDDLTGVVFVVVRAVADGLVGVLLLIAAVALARGRTDRAIGLARIGLLLSLTVATGLIFYLDQFLGAVVAAVQLTLLAGVERFERRPH
ncbi:hypothetical protein FDO65_19740 [Nakamurella flava]|uniref:Uncharacterized protein n=1 Tax=Nakamurella flava TaxID=2576308 RepID=A0A4U6QAY1_9ACTN|nr:hypothetical protein [Nakamurella flava]TKV57046.1 hypothetical protein FDO65_19740 [Nakamurella flava]